MLKTKEYHTQEIRFTSAIVENASDLILSFVNGWSHMANIDILEVTDTFIRVGGNIPDITFVCTKALASLSKNKDLEIYLGKIQPPIQSHEMDRDVITMSGISIGIIPNTGDLTSYIISNKDYGTQYNPYTQAVCTVLDKYVTKDTSVIDLGSGIGIPVLFSRALGATNVIGIELDEYQIGRAIYGAALNGFTDIRYIHQDYNEFIINTDEKFDIIIYNQTAYECANALSSILPIAKDNSIFILGGFSTDNMQLVRDSIDNISGMSIIYEIEDYDKCETNASLIVCQFRRDNNE